jgi:hypothetical protein
MGRIIDTHHWLSLRRGARVGILSTPPIAWSDGGIPLTPLNYATLALILFAATTVALTVGRLWRHRSTDQGYDVGTVSQRWLSEIRREDQ